MAPAGYARGIWLLSVPTTVALWGAVAGAAIALTLTDLSDPVAVVVGGSVGWILAAAVLGGAAERLDRRLHRMGGPRRRR